MFSVSNVSFAIFFLCILACFFFFCFKHKPAYEMRISDWISDVCSSDRRIRHATHHRTGDAWCIYPMYTWAHPVEDALEGITHSFCTLEFEDQCPFYDWILARLAELGQLAPPLPHQYEFARLNLSYVVTSKRKLRELVQQGHVQGWDDPRLPTLSGQIGREHV